MNGQLASSRTTKPLCYRVASNGTDCEPIDLSTFGLGENTLRVVVTSDGKTAEQSMTFTVINESDLPSTPDPEPITPNDQSGPPLNVTIEGIQSGDTVSGTRRIRAVVAGSSNPVSVRFKVNSTILADRFAQPYCMVESSGQCGDWDSASVPNGTHTLYIIATSQGFRDTWTSIPITVNNTNVASVTAGSTSTKTVVVGKSNQEVSGLTRVKIDRSSNRAIANVKYKIGNDERGEVLGSGTSVALIDTSTVPNGPQTLTATITSPDGSFEVIQSEVIVRNDILTSTSSWMRDNALVAGAVILGLAIAVYFIVHYVTMYIKNRNLRTQHAISESYEYVQPREQLNVKLQSAQGLAGVFLLFVGVLLVTRVNTTQAATGLGFVAEAELAFFVPDEFSMVVENHMDRYIQLNSSETSTPPTPSEPQLLLAVH